ncbi:OmpA family protein [Yoonia vestfoldensis]|uniref:OmpA family protein n=1 Tax=Yoonia vestfoldensis TaxID=245188 RepID=UPI000366A360|nr:OmpA family protein [Yoonia vestfoldensis]
MIRLAAVLLVLSSTAVQAQMLAFPADAEVLVEETSPLDSYALPVGIWANGSVPTTLVEGGMTRQAWRIETQSLTTLQLLRPLREQLRDSRFRILFECQTEACGGFDFRFATETLPPPEMQINLGDFRFLSAERTTADGPEYVTLFVSRTAQAGFVQVTRVAPVSPDAEPLAGALAPAAGQVSATDDIADQLDSIGRAILPDLDFATGSAQLGNRTYPSLTELAAYLDAQPDRSVALVGHTDAAGALDANIALSQRRARSVLERLVTVHAVNRAQLAAEGMGYLAPVATNLTDAGREANRRVEVIVTSTQ